MSDVGVRVSYFSRICTRKKQNKKVVDKCKIYKNGSIGNVSQSENTILYSAGLCKVNEFGINFHGNKAERDKWGYSIPGSCSLCISIVKSDTIGGWKC